MTSSNVDNLLKEIAGKKDKLVIFAGAGVSKAMGLPGWDDLLMNLCQKCKFINGIDDEELQKSYEMFTKGKSHHAVAQMCFDKLGEKTYKEIVRMNLNPSHAQYTSGHMKILKICNRIVTTNYDSGFKNAFLDYQYIKQEKRASLEEISLPDFDCQIRSNKIMYLHGKDEEDNIILKTDDYNYFYGQNNNSLLRLLDELYRQFTLLFIGFSFDDVFLFNTFEDIFKAILEENVNNRDFKRDAKEIKPSHYAIMNPIDDVLVDKLRDVGITVIPHDEGRYIEGQHYIDKVCEYISENESKQNNTYRSGGADVLSS